MSVAKKKRKAAMKKKRIRKLKKAADMFVKELANGLVEVDDEPLYNTFRTYIKDKIICHS